MMEIYYDPSKGRKRGGHPAGSLLFVEQPRQRYGRGCERGAWRQWEEAHGRGGVASTGRVRQRREENQKYSRRSKDGKNNGGV